MVLSAIAIGSNLGNSLAIACQAVEILQSTEGIKVLQVSHWYRTKAVILPNSPPQPDYINGCAILETVLSPLQLLDILLSIEQKCGRERRYKWSARTLDLDLLLCDQLVIHSDRLIVPHPRMTERSFVLLPLVEIAPHWQHPLIQKTIKELAQSPPDLDYCQPQIIWN
ncbi:MAG: 2-amino-4-hydroxy-6-hydroxymethyldihydropteridine diphosphokinase [Pseudanabaenaceae cyanobacterium]